MKYIRFSTLLLPIFLTISCQRDYVLEDIDDPLPTDTTQTSPTEPIDSTLSSDYGGLLTKIIYYDYVEDLGTDSIEANYIYDTENRLIEYNSYDKSIADPAMNDYGSLIKITRAPDGIIKQITMVTRIFETPDDNEPHYDVKFEFYNDESLSRHKYAIMTGFIEGNHKRDSITYEYNSTNQMITEVVHGYNAMNMPTKESFHITYDNKGNITRVNRFFEYEGNVSESYDLTYTYDNKAASGIFGTLSLLIFDQLDPLLPTGENNCTKIADKLDGFEYPAMSYVYNSFNKPARLTITDNGSNSNAEFIYFYKK